MIRYARACSSYECFILRARRLSSKLLKQGYLVERLKSSFRKFYCRCGDLIQQYEVSLSRMLNDILTLDQQWLPKQSDFPPISWPDTDFDLHRITSGFHGAFARVWHASRERLPLRTPGSVPFLGACMCSDCWDQFPRLYTDLMTYRSWLSPNWELSMEHLRQVCHASRERLPFRTPGSVPHFWTC